jgi:hypothetical protein
MNVPQVTKETRRSSQGRDFLGQQAIIQTMADACLPSFTNATRIMRYYPFWAWAFQQVIHKQPTGSEVWAYLLKLETALILANSYRNPRMIGMPGINGMRYSQSALSKMPDGRVIDLATTRNATAYAPVQYSPSLANLGIVRRDGKTCELLQHGRALATAFDAGIPKGEAYTKLVSAQETEIEWGALKSLSEALSLQSPRPDEVSVFKEAMFGKDSAWIGSAYSRRRQTTRVILMLIRHLGIATSTQFKAQLWLCPLDVDPELKEIRVAWQLVEARRIYQYFIETILAVFSRFLYQMAEESISSFGAFNDFVLKGALPDYLSTNADWSMRFDTYRDRLRNSAELQNLTEWNVIERITRILLKDNELSNAVIEAFNGILMLLDSIAALPVSDSALTSSFYVEPTGYRHSFSHCAELLSSWGRLTLAEALSRATVELSLKLHLGVAQDRWYTTGNFNFRFIAADRGGYMSVQAKDDPVMTENKAGSFLDILVDIGYLEVEKGSYAIASEGQKFLDGEI